MKLSVIIVNYNVKYYIDQCIRSVLKAIDVVDSERNGNLVEVIVVDNHSLMDPLSIWKSVILSLFILC